MKVYTEHVWCCYNCPNRQKGYGADYCSNSGKDIHNTNEISWHCPLPNSEETQCK